MFPPIMGEVSSVGIGASASVLSAVPVAAPVPWSADTGFPVAAGPLVEVVPGLEELADCDPGPCGLRAPTCPIACPSTDPRRSEERRVGKECREWGGAAC